MTDVLKLTNEQKRKIEELKSYDLLKPKNIISVLENNIFYLMDIGCTKKQIVVYLEKELSIHINYPHFSTLIKQKEAERKNKDSKSNQEIKDENISLSDFDNSKLGDMFGDISKFNK